MWQINIIILLLILLGYLLCRMKQEEWIHQVDKKEDKLYFLYPMANNIIVRTGLERYLNKKKTVSDSIKALYVTAKPVLNRKLFWCRQISQIIVVIVLFNLLSILGFFMDESNSPIIDGKYIYRPDYGEGDAKVKLNITIEESDSSADKTGRLSTSQDITLNVKERQYTQAEVEQIFNKAKNYLNDNVLGENQSADEIFYPLEFCSDIPGTSITVKWFPKDYSLIHSDGSLNNEGIKQEGIPTWIKVVLTYYEYQSEFQMNFRIMPKQYSKKEVLENDLKNELQANSDKTATDQLLELPQAMEKYSIHWESTGNNSGWNILLLGMIVAIVIWVYGDKELDLRMRKRKQQMLLDYPELINKFTLLINAGMTIKQAWYKIAEDYFSKTSQKGSQKHYAYEEMLATVRELKLGLPEGTAYEDYGRRIGLIPYIRFTTLISQNLKKGTKGFTDTLLREAIEAFEERKEIAKRQGEEAGTKLLIPMTIMLIIVFLIIIIPAFSAFSI